VVLGAARAVAVPGEDLLDERCSRTSSGSGMPSSISPHVKAAATSAAASVIVVVQARAAAAIVASRS
jgi:hypothetical protein